MGKEIHDKSKDKVKETDQKSESRNALNEQALELRKGGADPGALKQLDTATQHLPAVDMTPGLQGGQGPYQALQKQHKDWDAKKIAAESHYIKEQTGRESFRQGEQFRRNEDGSVSTRLKDKNGFSESTSKNGKVLETHKHAANADGSTTDTVENKIDGSKLISKQEMDGQRTETKFDKDGKQTETKFGKDGKQITPSENMPQREEPKENGDKKGEGKNKGDGAQNSEQNKGAAKKEWTIAVELAATMPGGAENPQGFGADNKLAMLKSLAKETEGKSVIFVLEAERTTNKKGGLCHDENKPLSQEKANSCDLEAAKNGRQKSERYFIHDGKIDRLPDSKAKDEGAQLKDLLQETQKLSPSDKIGLIIQSHGAGPDGIETNLGKASLQKTMNGIKDGLKGGEHEKLDFLDFDACNMGTAPVLDEAAGASKALVASAASEAGGKRGESGDGQNLVAGLRSLLNNPSQSGKELAAGFVESARRGDNGLDKENTTSTLAAFDLSKFEGFKNSLDNFGEQLKNAAGDKNNLAALRAVVDASVRPETELGETESHERDLRSFAENTLGAIESGKLNPKDNALEQSAKDFLKSLDDLTINRFGEKAKGYEELGGLSTNLPGKEILDKNEIGKLLSPIHEESSKIQKHLNEPIQLSDRDSLANEAKEGLSQLHQMLDGAPGHPLKKLDGQVKLLSKAASLEELSTAMQKLKNEYDNLEKSPIGRRIAKDAEQDASREKAHYRKQRPHSIAAGWDAFIRKLEASGNI